MLAVKLFDQMRACDHTLHHMITSDRQQQTGRTLRIGHRDKRADNFTPTSPGDVLGAEMGAPSEETRGKTSRAPSWQTIFSRRTYLVGTLIRNASRCKQAANTASEIHFSIYGVRIVRPLCLSRALVRQLVGNFSARRRAAARNPPVVNPGTGIVIAEHELARRGKPTRAGATAPKRVGYN
ncbi:hypothetical protein Bbelb_053740 [Branchiostoma belcheri]|nr:hypothetical protein Bbelb_053740 [Branchiostoma belcheri]